MAKYQKLDSELGYVEDIADIEYLKFNNLRHTISGFMLGDFDSEGNYVVDPDLVKELINMKKYIVETIDNIDICVSNLKLDKQISFLVTFEGERATLTLVEKLNYEANNKQNSGVYSNINEYLLDEVETSGEVDKTILYNRWNISTTEGEAEDVFKMDEETIAVLYSLIVNRFKENLVANKMLLDKEEEIEEIESEYATDVFEILTHYPKLKKATDLAIKSALKENNRFIKFDKPNFAKTLNEVIAQKIEENKSVLTDDEKKEFNSEIHNAKVNYNNKIGERLDIQEENLFDNSDDIEKNIPPIVRLKTNGEENRPLNDLAKEYVEAERNAINRVQFNAVRLLSGKRLATVGLIGAIVSGNKDEKISSKSKLKMALDEFGIDVLSLTDEQTQTEVKEQTKQKETKAEVVKENSLEQTKANASTKSAPNKKGATKSGGSGGKGGGGKKKKEEKKEQVATTGTSFSTSSSSTTNNRVDVATNYNEQQSIIGSAAKQNKQASTNAQRARTTINTDDLDLIDTKGNSNQINTNISQSTDIKVENERGVNVEIEPSF